MKRLWGAFKFLSVAGRFGASRDQTIGACAAYFPIVGLFLGAVLVGLDRLVEPVVESEIAAAIVVTFLIFLTGAIHLEGTQRTLDGLVAPDNYTSRRLTIYGVLAVVLVITFKIRAVEVMGETRSVGLLLAPVFARWASVLFLYGSAWSEEEPTPRIAAKVTLWQLVVATLATLGIAAFLTGRVGLWVALLVSVLALVSRAYFQRYHDGVNRDRLGAVIELSETLSLVLLGSL